MDPDVVVPNMPPVVDPGTVRLAVVGESGAVEEASWCYCSSGHGFAREHWSNRQLVQRDRCSFCGSTRFEHRPEPFRGESGRLLDSLLKDAGLPRERCWVGNVSRHPLSEGEKTLEHCKGGLARLAYDLEQFKPNVVLCLGNLALAAFLGEGHAVTNWRGSLFEGTLAGVAYKCCAAMHPAAILREPGQLCLLRSDVAKAVAEAASPTLILPKRYLHKPGTAVVVCDALKAMQNRCLPIGHDIEGGVDVGVTVCSFASSPIDVLSIPFKRMDWSRVWNDVDERMILDAVRAILEDRYVPKVAHSAMYELFAWRWLHGIQIRNVEDSMIAFHCCYPELEKGLEIVASLYTRQPYWGTPKDWKTDEDRDCYNAIDSCVCLECFQAVQFEMTSAQRVYYEHERALLEPCLEMSFEGMAYDAAKRDAMVAALEREVHTLSGELDSLAGIPLPTYADVRDAVAMKIRHAKCASWDDLLTFAKPSMKEQA